MQRRSWGCRRRGSHRYFKDAEGIAISKGIEKLVVVASSKGFITEAEMTEAGIPLSPLSFENAFKMACGEKNIAMKKPRPSEKELSDLAEHRQRCLLITFDAVIKKREKRLAAIALLEHDAELKRIARLETKEWKDFLAEAQKQYPPLLDEIMKQRVREKANLADKRADLKKLIDSYFSRISNDAQKRNKRKKEDVAEKKRKWTASVMKFLDDGQVFQSAAALVKKSSAMILQKCAEFSQICSTFTGDLFTKKRQQPTASEERAQPDQPEPTSHIILQNPNKRQRKANPKYT